MITMTKRLDCIISQRNRYLEDLGLEPYEYGVNWTLRGGNKKVMKRWEKQRKRYGFDERETYEVYTVYAEWLYSHLMMYRKKASGVIDLTYHSIEFEGRTYTEIEAIDRVLKWTGYFLRHHNDLDR